MPDPICGAAQPNDLASVDPTTDDSTCAAPAPLPPATAPNQSRVCAPSTDCTTETGVSLLVDRYGQKDYSAFIANESAAPTAPPVASVNVLASTDLRDSQGFTDGFSAVKAQASFVNEEALSVSVQGGEQNSVQAGVLHVAPHVRVLGVNFSGSADTLNLRANLGIHNDDGSTGANIGVMATGAGVEVTAERSGWSATLGFSQSVGVAVSSGEGRDIDGDGDPERCFKLSVGPASVGFCAEL